MRRTGTFTSLGTSLVSACGQRTTCGLLLGQCHGLHGRDFVPDLLSSPPLINGRVGAQGDIDGCVFN